MELRNDGHGDLFAARGKLLSQRTIRIGAQITAGQQGLALLCRLARDDFGEIVGMPKDANLAWAARILLLAAATSDAGGVEVMLTGNRPKVGPPLARPVADEDGDWLIGPVAFPEPAADRAGLLEHYARQGLMPLTWKSVEARAARGKLLLPDLLSLRAEICDGNTILLPGAMAAVRRRVARNQSNNRSHGPDMAMLPLLAACPAPTSGPDLLTGETRPAETVSDPVATTQRGADREQPITRRGAVRVTVGEAGRLGLTLTKEAMASLWMGREPSDERVCAVALSGADLLVLPGDDALVRHFDGLLLRLRLTGPSWYGRAPVSQASGNLRALLAALGQTKMREGRGFVADLQPGRLVLKGAFGARAAAAATPVQAPVAEDIGRASRLMSEALTLVRQARQNSAMSQLDIVLFDDGGRQILSVPPEAVTARVRFEVA
jgi:hypothetical protein